MEEWSSTRFAGRVIKSKFQILTHLIFLWQRNWLFDRDADKWVLAEHTKCKELIDAYEKKQQTDNDDADGEDDDKENESLNSTN